MITTAFLMSDTHVVLLQVSKVIFRIIYNVCKSQDLSHGKVCKGKQILYVILVGNVLKVKRKHQFWSMF